MTAPSNELVLVDNAIEEAQSARQTPLPGDIAFELFACEQLLRDYDLGTDEVEAGRVGAGLDAALDGVYVFLGDTLLSEDSEILSENAVAASFPRGQDLTLWLIQAKRAQSFTETAIDLASSSLARLLDLQQTEENLLQLYSAAVVQRVRMFTTAWQRLASRRPNLHVRLVYASRGDVTTINDRVQHKADGEFVRYVFDKAFPGAARTDRVAAPVRALPADVRSAKA